MIDQTANFIATIAAAASLSMHGDPQYLDSQAQFLEQFDAIISYDLETYNRNLDLLFVDEATAELVMPSLCEELQGMTELEWRIAAMPANGGNRPYSTCHLSKQHPRKAAL